jgi:ABC-type glycerol-3-phosphate transport system substrate-binding protein
MAHVKQVILALLILAAIAVLVMPIQTEFGAPADRTVVRYWSYWSGREADQMQEIIDEFNTTVGAEKKIWVQYISMSQADEKTLIATAAGVPPDVAGVWGDQIAQFAAMNAVIPLEEMAAEHGITREYYKKAYWEASSFEGHLYGLVATPYSVGLYYNKQIFLERAEQLKAAGLDPTRPPRTIDELDKYAAALEVWDRSDPKNPHLKAAGFFEQQPGWWREHLYHWFGGSIYDDNTKKLSLDSQQVVAAYDWMKSYSTRIGASQVMEFSSGIPSVDSFDTPLNPFMTGAIAMMKQGPWFSSYMETLNPSMNRWKMSKEEEAKLPRLQRRDNYMWGVAPFPSISENLKDVTFAGVDLLVIPKTSKHQKEAFEFIAFVNRQDVMERLCSMHGKNSPIAKMSEHYIETHFNPYIEIFEQLGASENAHPVPPIPIWPEIRSELQAISGTVVLGEKDPKEMLVEAQSRLQKRLDDFNERREQRRKIGLLK